MDRDGRALRVRARIPHSRIPNPISIHRLPASQGRGALLVVSDDALLKKIRQNVCKNHG